MVRRRAEPNVSQQPRTHIRCLDSLQVNTQTSNPHIYRSKSYLHIMAQLEWFYFGQIPMGSTKFPVTQGKIAVALNTENEDGWTFLRKMFGVKED